MFLDAGSIVLRPAKESDREPLTAVLMDADVMRLALDERPLTRGEAETVVETQFAVGDEVLGMHSISVDSTSEPIGFSGYRRCTLLGVDDVEFGWVIAKRHQGRGYATALGQALIRYGLDELKLNRILAACNPANGPSEHILRDKLKMRFEREVEPRPNFRRRVYSAMPNAGGSSTLMRSGSVSLPIPMDLADCIARRVSTAEADDVFSLVEEYYDAVQVVARDDRAKLFDYLADGECGVWLACCDTSAVGCILYHPLPEMGSAGEVKRLYVRPAFRGRGIARELLESLEQ